MSRPVEDEAAAPLGNHSFARTSDADELEHAVIRTYGARNLDVIQPAGLWVVGNFVQMQDVGLGYSSNTARTVVHYGESEYARVKFVTRGKIGVHSGADVRAAAVGQSIVTSPYRAAKVDYGADIQQFSLHVPAAVLAEKITALTGFSQRQKIAFEPDAFASSRMTAGLLAMVKSLAGLLDASDRALISPIALREFEQAVITQLLLVSRHNFTPLFEDDADRSMPFEVRRAAEFIEANWNRPLEMERIVEASGVSARSLFKAFAKTYSLSPMMFAKKLRLEHARRKLSAPDPTTSVTGTAFACGFANLGHFARDYREMFGELPSQTLSRQARRIG